MSSRILKKNPQQDVDSDQHGYEDSDTEEDFAEIHRKLMRTNSVQDRVHIFSSIWSFLVQAISTKVKNQHLDFVLLQRVETFQIDVFTHLSSGNCYVQQHLQRSSDIMKFMMPIDGDKIWQPSLVSRRLLEEHLCFWGQKYKEGRKGSKHPCQLLQTVHILICCMLLKCTTFPKTTHNSLGWIF